MPKARSVHKTHNEMPPRVDENEEGAVRFNNVSYLAGDGFALYEQFNVVGEGVDLEIYWRLCFTANPQHLVDDRGICVRCGNLVD